MKKYLLGLAIIACVVAAFPAFAMDLHQARHSGLIGEKADGYVAVLKATPEAQALAQDVNAKRRQEYTRISNENKQPIAIVSALAAKQIVDTLEAGDRYQDSSGAWKTR